MIENPRERVILTSTWENFWPESVVECDFEGFEILRVELVGNENVSLAMAMRLEVDNNNIDEFVEEHSQELTTEGFKAFHHVSQQEDVEESLSEEEKVTAKQQSSDEIREMLKAWKAIASYIKNHHANKAVAIRAKNLFNDNAVSHFRQMLKLGKNKYSRQISSKKELGMYNK
ncbi:hypothetical protein AVEN_7381-1 [Araneus ventricosus]|uniref:Uncharacterized protein n=1 Tax=Araneus ventricosus TaxID=182803 RepID=A0A4Y2BR33_ARAVE|nr:hypothetical protein AVEN_7381-1 [Araneus ventricosus]